ncbi:MAG: FAD-binding protein [Spirosomataceae bacterium]
MNKRTFLKTSSVLVTGGIISHLLACEETPREKRTNWAGNYTYSTDNIDYPKTVEELQNLVKKYKHLRGLGTKHCFNGIADSKENQISLRDMNKVVSLDKANNTVTIEAGMNYGQLCEYLHKNGYALHNLASLPHISVAGACATATHGSGVENGNLATAVSAIEFVNAAGELITLSKAKDGDKFNGAVVGLGSIGIVTKITLDLLPTFEVTQLVYRNMPMSALEKDFQKIVSSGYSVSLFTDWKNKNVNQVWIKSKANSDIKDAPTEFYGAKLADKNMHPLDDHSPENCTNQMGVAGPWYERLPHFKMGFTPSSGKELQSEYFLPIEYAYDAMMAIESLHEQVSPHLFISEIRTIKADDFWMSPCYKRTCVAFHFTWKPEWDAVQKLLPLIEEKIMPYKALPHWGKLFTIKSDYLQSTITRINDFKALMAEYDPEGKFRNDYINSHLFGVS